MGAFQIMTQVSWICCCHNQPHLKISFGQLKAVGSQAVFIVNVLVRFSEHHWRKQVYIIIFISFTCLPFTDIFIFAWINVGLLFHEQL